MTHMDTYAEIMKESEIRKRYVSELIERIQQILKLTFSEKEYEELNEALSCFEVEDGVSLFKPSSKPRDKKRIAAVKLAKKNLVLWWGKNRNASSYSKYSLGLTFENKKKDDIYYYTLKELEDEFPAFKDCFASWEKGYVYTLHAYAKAGSFYNGVKEITVGEWLLQKPNTLNKSFIPYMPIGKRVSGVEYHLFQPKSNYEFTRKIMIV